VPPMPTQNKTECGPPNYGIMPPNERHLNRLLRSSSAATHRTTAAALEAKYVPASKPTHYSSRITRSSGKHLQRTAGASRENNQQSFLCCRLLHRSLEVDARSPSGGGCRTDFGTANLEQEWVVSRGAVSTASCIPITGNRCSTLKHRTDATAISTRTAGVPSWKPDTRPPGLHCWRPDELTGVATNTWRAILRRPKG
jgi:hypothetical protein